MDKKLRIALKHEFLLYATLGENIVKNDDGQAISLLKMCDAELRDKIFFFFL